jgi:hypothetical protein
MTVQISSFFLCCGLSPIKKGSRFWNGLILEHTGVQGQFKRCGVLSIKSREKTPGWMRFKYPNWIESVKGKVQRREQPIPKLGEMDGNKRIISII